MQVSLEAQVRLKFRRPALQVLVPGTQSLKIYTRRCVGWHVQYFGTVEPQKRGAPHFHAALRGTIPRTQLRAITAATYHQVWWPSHDQLIYSGERLPVWDPRAKAFTDPDTGVLLPSLGASV